MNWGDVGHRAWPVEGVQGDEVFYRVRFGAPQDSLHAGTFKLKDAGII